MQRTAPVLLPSSHYSTCTSFSFSLTLLSPSTFSSTDSSTSWLQSPPQHHFLQVTPHLHLLRNMADYTAAELDDSLLALLPELLPPQRPAIRPSRPASRPRRSAFSNRQSPKGSAPTEQSTDTTAPPVVSSGDVQPISQCNTRYDSLDLPPRSKETLPKHEQTSYDDPLSYSQPEVNEDTFPVEVRSPTTSPTLLSPAHRTPSSPKQFRIPIRRRASSAAVYTTTFAFKIKSRNKVGRSTSIGSASSPLRFKVDMLSVCMYVCLSFFTLN